MMHRWNQHCAQAKHLKSEKRSHFAAAIRKYGKDAFAHEVLETVDSLEAACEAEKRHMRDLKTQDPRFGFNIASGGRGGPSVRENPWLRKEYRSKMVSITSSPEFKAKISATATGRVLDEETRAAISNRMTGRSKSDVVKTRISESLRGHRLSDETREKISAAGKNRTTPAETREKISRANTGKRHSPESIAKMSLVQKQKAAERTARTFRCP
jgi:hypothetical protein